MFAPGSAIDRILHFASLHMQRISARELLICRGPHLSLTGLLPSR